MDTSARIRRARSAAEAAVNRRMTMSAGANEENIALKRLAHMTPEEVQKEGVKMMSSLLTRLEAAEQRAEEWQAKADEARDKIEERDQKRRDDYDEYLKRQEKRAEKSLEQAEKLNEILHDIASLLINTSVDKPPTASAIVIVDDE
jgi:hypothetical protein